MKINTVSLEYSLLAASLIFAFLYFVFRALVWDQFIWIIIAPAIGFAYAAAIGGKILPNPSNSLDKIIKWYLIYGIVITVVVVFALSYGYGLGIKYFIHYYAPAILYFIARKYTSSSSAHIANLTALIWIIAIVFIVDVSVEYYVTVVLEKPLSIPWKKTVVLGSSEYGIEYWEDVQMGYTVAPQSWTRQSWGLVHSIMKGRKATGMVAVVLFVFILPYYSVRKSRTNDGPNQRWRFNIALNIAILTALIWVAYIAMNKVDIGAGILVLGLVYFLTRTVKLGVFIGLLVFLGAVTFQSLIFNVWEHAVLVDTYDFGYGKTQTPFQRTTDLGPIIRGYADTPIDILIVGHYQREPWRGIFDEARQTNMALGYPARFGIMWGIIVLAGFFIVARYCLALIREGRFTALGLACLGVLLVYAADIHDPSSVRHGPFELAFILAGTLASAREIVRERIPKSVVSTQLVARHGRARSIGSND